MLRSVYIKLTKVSYTAGPFNIYDQYNNLIAENVSREELIDGKGYLLDKDITLIRVVSVGDCSYEKVIEIKPLNREDNEHVVKDFYNTPLENTATSCIWRHITNKNIYNTYYGVIHPYIIEYPFSYEYFDQIVQNVKDYTKAYRYIYSGDAFYTTAMQIELDDEFFNKAIVYNGQQSSGMLNLVVKPKHNLKSYMSYPIFNNDSKTITYTKSDSFYQYNDFWDVVKDKKIPLFIQTCESMSIDKVVNQSNMDYGKRSFTKAPIRGKETRIRHILDNRSDVHMVSRILIVPSQISYK